VDGVGVKGSLTRFGFIADVEFVLPIVNVAKSEQLKKSVIVTK